MNIPLDPDLERFILDKVKAGQYADPADVIRGALTILRDEEQWGAEDVVQLRAALQPALNQADAAHFVPFTAEDIIAEGRNRLAL